MLVRMTNVKQPLSQPGVGTKMGGRARDLWVPHMPTPGLNGEPV